MLLFFLACSGSTESTPAAAGGASVEPPAAAEQSAAEPLTEPVAAEQSAETDAEAQTVETDAEADAAEADAEVQTVEADAVEPAPVVATTYTLSPSASRLYVQVFKDPDTLGSGASHDHVIVAKGWSGTVTWHPTDASQCQIDITVPVKKLSVDPSAMRTAVGYDSELSDSQRGSVKKNMLASDQLNSASFPSITFSSTSCSGTTGSVTVTGKMSIRGKSKTISTALSVSVDDGFSATGAFNASHTDFGFDPFSAMMGALMNKNQMTFTVRLRGS